MARELNDILASLPAARLKKVQARTEALVTEARGLIAVRKLANKSQAQIAARLGKKQPSIHKMETQADYLVSTLERFVEAAGGTVDIIVTLPDQPPMKFKRFSDLHEATE